MPIDMAVLDRSHKFHHALRVALIGETERAIPPGARSNATFSYCKIALEHGSAFQTLLAEDNPTSALALVRLQYEAVLRGAWIFYAAPESWVDTFSSQPESYEGAERAKFPLVRELLRQLTASQAEPVLPQSLTALKEKAWDALNSYTHGGLRLMISSLDGFDDAMLLWMLRTTNSLSYIAAQLLAQVANDPACSNTLRSTRSAMSDCMHE